MLEVVSVAEWEGMWEVASVAELDGMWEVVSEAVDKEHNIQFRIGLEDNHSCV